VARLANRRRERSERLAKVGTGTPVRTLTDAQNRVRIRVRWRRDARGVKAGANASVQGLLAGAVADHQQDLGDVGLHTAAVDTA
jgi:hypothetical protein